jgi:methylated-DNA-[protein]-cysteine S-methyltransferase
LDEYFEGKRRQFDLPFYYEGTVFQRRVWEELRKIPYGETRSYEDIAVQVGNPKAQRAIGQANNRNPLLIIVPCHRVIHKNGDISGFACGIEAKRYLLDLETRSQEQ